MNIIIFIVFSCLLECAVSESSPCDLGYYSCSNGNCVHEFTVCDGINDCLDNSEETTLCPNGTLQYFQDNFLIVADVEIPGLFQVDISTGNVRHLRAGGVHRPIAVAFDSANMEVYYSDEISVAINKYSLRTHVTTNIYIDRTGLSVFEGLALDIYRGYIYVSDARFSQGSSKAVGNGSIVELDMYGNIRRTLVHSIGMLPRSLALDTQNRILYWSDWGISGIYKISLVDPNAVRIPIITQDVSWPNAMAVDFTRQEIYWGDAALHRIEVANIDGSNRRVLAQQPEAHYFDMTITSGYVYFTDWISTNIKKLDRTTLQVQNYPNNKFIILNGITHYQSASSPGVAPSTTTTTQSTTVKTSTAKTTKATTMLMSSSTTTTTSTIKTTSITKTTSTATSSLLKSFSPTSSSSSTTSTMSRSSVAKSTVDTRLRSPPPNDFYPGDSSQRSPGTSTSNPTPQDGTTAKSDDADFPVQTVVIVVVVVGAVVLISAMLTCCVLCRRRRRDLPSKSVETVNNNNDYEVPVIESPTYESKDYTTLSKPGFENPALSNGSRDYESLQRSSLPPPYNEAVLSSVTVTPTIPNTMSSVQLH